MQATEETRRKARAAYCLLREQGESVKRAASGYSKAYKKGLEVKLIINKRMCKYRQTDNWKKYWRKRRKESAVYKKNRLAYKERKRNE